MTEIVPRPNYVNLSGSQTARTDTLLNASPEFGFDPVCLTLEASRARACRSAHAGDPVVSAPEADGTTLSCQALSRQGTSLAPPVTDRALEIRITKIEEELAAKADEYDGLYERGDAILEEMLDLQQRLRTFREIVLKRGGHA